MRRGVQFDNVYPRLRFNQKRPDNVAGRFDLTRRPVGQYVGGLEDPRRADPLCIWLTSFQYQQILQNLRDGIQAVTNKRSSNPFRHSRRLPE